MKTAIKMRKIISICILTVSSIQLMAQGNGYKEEVIVVAPYQPTVSDAFKINRQPVIADTQQFRQELKYKVPGRQVPTAYAAEAIKAAKIGDPSLTKLYRYLVKAGFGNYTTPYGEFFVNNLYSKSFTAGGHYRHYSSSGKIKDYAYPGYSDNSVSVYGKKFFAAHTFTGDLKFDRNVVHNYGLKPDEYFIPPHKNDIKQRYARVGTDLLFASSYPSDSLKLNHKVGLGYHYLWDITNSSESALKIKMGADKDLHLFKITSSQLLGAEINADYFFNSDTSGDYNSGVISVKPYIKTAFKGFLFNAGMDLAIQADSISYLHFYPFADVQFNIYKNILVVYGGVDGGLQRNNLAAVSTENPYVRSFPSLGFSETKYRFFGGIKSSLSRTLNFRAGASWSSIKSLPLYVNDTNNGYLNTFDLIYDDARLLRVTGELAYQNSTRLTLLLGGSYYKYTMDNELKAWHKPRFDAYIDMVYNIQNKFIISANITGRSDIWAKDYSSTSVFARNINGFVDASLGFEYRYSKILAAFININNLTASRYYLWNRYPSYGFNAMIGASYSF
jgi:hypothetical protein